MILKNLINLILILGISNSAFSQNEKVELLGKATENSIKLRWAPNDPALWKLSNQYGYQILKYTILYKGELLSPPTVVKLNEDPVKPFPVGQWESFADVDDYAAVAAEAIYGESFDVTESQSNDFMTMVNKSKDLENRYSFAIYAAEQSLKVSEYSGLAYIDKDVRPGEKYLYKVFSMVPQDLIKSDTGVFYVGLADVSALPNISNFSIEFKDQMAVLGWSTKFISDYYSSYFIEKSTNGKDFERITEKPVLNSSLKEIDQKEYFVRIDSLEENLKTYHYRIQGVDAFGDLGPYSKVVTGEGKPDFYYPVEIAEAKAIENNRVSVSWVFDEEAKQNLSHFLITRASKEGDEYEVVQRMGAQSDSFTDLNPKLSNYYVVKAVDKFGSEVSSLPYFVQLEDMIPPAMPKGLVGKVDTLGNVTISWEANTDEDLLGYRVYKKNFKSDDYIQITPDIITENSFREKIKVKSLTKDIYYGVRAIDKRYNDSEFSQSLKLSKPDLIPPSMPVISKFTSIDLGVRINWINSSSDDVIGHLIYREEEKSGDWVLIQSIPISDVINNTYLDESVKAGNFYKYTVIAMDDASLESDPADPVSLKFNADRQIVVNVTGNVDKVAKAIRVYWQVSDEDVVDIQLYRGIDQKGMSMYKRLNVKDGVFADDKVIINKSYQYMIRPVMADGSLGKFSKKIDLKY